MQKLTVKLVYTAFDDVQNFRGYLNRKDLRQFYVFVQNSHFFIYHGIVSYIFNILKLLNFQTQTITYSDSTANLVYFYKKAQK